MNRRNFLTNTLATTAAMATSAEVLAQKSTKTNLEVIVLATNWGFELGPMVLGWTLLATGFWAIALGSWTVAPFLAAFGVPMVTRRQ